MEEAGPLGTPLGLAQRKRASPRGEAGTSGFLCVSARHAHGDLTSLAPHGIFVKQHLHKPMYYFLSMLSAADLCLTITTLPTVLGVLWFHAREISFKACLIQMFFVHAFSFLESSVLAIMAFDRFMAICNPLKYATVLKDTLEMRPSSIAPNPA